MKSRFHLSKSDKPEWLDYPSMFDDMVANDQDDLGLWYLMTATQVLERSKGLQKRYPQRTLLPFARRDDNDDVACWEKSAGNVKVVVIHDFASEGFEQKAVYETFDDWFNTAITEAQDY